jgi:hypothetical protein
MFMANADEPRHDLDDLLFGADAADPPSPERQPRELDFPQPADVASTEARGRAVTVDVLDAALFGRDAPSARTATEETVSTERNPAPAVVAPIFDEEDDGLASQPSVESEASRLGDRDQGHRRVRTALTVLLALAVVIGAGVGALALTRSDGSRPKVRTGTDGTKATTVTTATTTAVTTTPPPPETLAPAPAVDSRPPPTTRRAPVPTTAPRSVTPPRSVAPPPPPAEPPPREPPPPPPPPPDPPPPPSTSPPPTSTLPLFP